ncbi:tryptophan dimethylallyltransferase-domain-containing protein [Hypoxylon argillaceum]|nr:tryptophan dimethylallyltransferase-domain-containing protein [Hypoxylon argillaceum]
MGRTQTLVQTQNIAFDVSYNEFSAWKQVDSNVPDSEDEHRRSWYQHIGKALGVLLYSADYSPEAQRRSLNFFKQLVAPNLGVFPATNSSLTKAWESFMTDDGTPVELSWDWGTSDSRPTIRYSIEPIGLQAGTSVDPRNLLVGPIFQDRLNQSLPDIRLEWFDYFKDFFDDFQDHSSSIFYAFDLTESEITAKVYYFPKYRAISSGKSNLEVLLESMKGAPHSTKDNLEALSVFSNFSNDPASKDLEYEMLAIDLIDPFKSRFKVYFRSRETSFESLCNIITLGGRIKSPNMQKGLEDLHSLWNAIFGVNAPSTDPLKEVNHRTAGMLYNVEFRIGDQFPVAKVYLPVRHYASSDAAVIRGLDEYFKSHQRGSYMAAYSGTMNALFGSELLASQKGVQTYVGCTIRPDGALRVVSYFKPPLSEPNVSVERDL